MTTHHLQERILAPLLDFYVSSAKFKFDAKSFLNVDPEKFQVVARSTGGLGSRLGGGQVNWRGGTAGSTGQEGSELEKGPVGL